jgi:hypothetical protein
MPQDKPSGTTDTTKGIGEILKLFGKSMGEFQAPSPSQIITGQAGFPRIQFDPSRTPGTAPTTAPPPGFVPFQPSGGESIGNFNNPASARNAGMVSLGNSILGLVNTLEERETKKKQMQASSLMLQVNDFLQSGDPKDRERAMMILDDPKNRKILKTGLGYVPYQEEQEPPSPEAVGVQDALQRIVKPQDEGPNQMQGQQGMSQQRPQGGMRTVLPQPSQQAQMMSALSSAVMQKLKQDPASALSMMGVSQLSATEQRLGEFYEKGLGVSPADAEKLSSLQKIEGIKAYSQLFSDMLKGQLELEKLDIQQTGMNKRNAASNLSREKVAGILGGVRERISKAAQDAKGDHNIASANVYRSFAEQFATRSQTPNISEEDKLKYEQQSQFYMLKADEFATKSQDEDLIKIMAPYLFGDINAGEVPDLGGQ